MARCNIGTCLGSARYVATWSWGEQKRLCGECLPSLRLLATSLGEVDKLAIVDQRPMEPAPTADRALLAWLAARRNK